MTRRGLFAMIAAALAGRKIPAPPKWIIGGTEIRISSVVPRNQIWFLSRGWTLREYEERRAAALRVMNLGSTSNGWRR